MSNGTTGARSSPWRDRGKLTGMVMATLIAYFAYGALQPVQAQAVDIAANNFELRLGGFLTITDTDLRLSTSPDSGTEFDLERNFGVDRSRVVFRGDGLIRFRKRHRIDAGYFRLSRSSSRMIDREFTIGDKFFDIDATIKTKTRIEVFKISYGYMLFNDERYEFGPTIGLFMQRNGVSMTNVDTAELVAEDTNLPLPVIGLRGGYQFTDRLSLLGAVEVFFISFDKYSGSLVDARVALEYDVLDNFGVGVGFNWIDIDASVENPSLIWDIGYKISGLTAYAKVAF